MAEWFKGFQDVDASSEIKALLSSMDVVNTNPSILSYRERLTEICSVGSGHRVLDVGCGLGQEVQRLAKLVGPTGRVVGIDRSSAMVEEAIRRAKKVRLPVEFEIDDVHEMKHSDNSFDLSRTERTLMYVENPSQAIKEMARVVRPGGHVASYEFDYAGFFIDSDLEPLTRRVEKALLAGPPNPLIGRQLSYYYRKAGLDIEHIEPFTTTFNVEFVRNVYDAPLRQAVESGEISTEEIDAWWREQEDRSQAGTSFVAHSGFIVVGRKKGA